MQRGKGQEPYLMELSDLKAGQRLARRSGGRRSPDQLPDVGWVDSGALTVKDGYQRDLARAGGMHAQSRVN